MTDTLSTAAASLAEAQARLDASAVLAHDFYASIASTGRELGRMRGALALFMADPGDASDNAKGFAQNVAHALDGLDRVLSEASRATLAVVTIKREFAASVESWQDAVATPPTP